MKRTDLLKKLRAIAKQKGLTYDESEGGRHTKVSVGDKQTTVPRHNEINELTAKGIIKHMEGAS